MTFKPVTEITHEASFREIRKEATRINNPPFTDFQIFVDDSEGMSGDVAVSWCLSPSLVEYLKDNNFTHPVVVLTAIKANGYEVGKRVVVPLNDMMTYYRFISPGDTKLKAFLFVNEETSFKGSQEILTSKWGRISYQFDLIYEGMGIRTETKQWGNSAHTLFTDSYNDGMIYISECNVTVNVPESAFSKPLNARVQYFLNWMHPTEPEDDCAQRRRIIGLLTWKWPIIVGYAIWHITIRLLLSIISFSLGWTTIRWREVFRPWTGTMNYVFSDTVDHQNGSGYESNQFSIPTEEYWTVTSSDGKAEFRSQGVVLPWWMLTPAWITILAIIPLLMANTQGGTYMEYATPVFLVGLLAPLLVMCTIYTVIKIGSNHDRWSYELRLLREHKNTPKAWWIYPILVVMGVFLVVFNIMIIIGKILYSPIALVEKGIGKLEDRAEAKELARNDFTNNEDFLCHNIAEDHIPALDTIPANRISYGLKYKKFKQKVCKPIIR